MDWFDAIIESRQSISGAVRLFLGVGAEVRASFTAPGQYLHLKVGHAHGPFAPASAPFSEGPLELLFKTGTPLTDGLEALAVGQTLQVTRAEGHGFPLEKAKGHPLLLVASGTGQAPMRSVVESIRADRRAYGPVTLLLGVRSYEHLAYTSEHPAWEADGIDVHVTLSQGPASWKGRTGWVQRHLPHGHLEDTVAFLVGQKAMVEEVRAALAGRGLPRGRVFLNV
jgi:sulfhydrogenase subunit gamma (sulfur reductase)